MVAPLEQRRHSKMYEEKAEARLPTFQGNSGEEFSLWELRVKAALRAKNLIEALTKNTVEGKVSKKALFKIIFALGDNPLRSIQEYETANEAWNKLQQRYAGKTVINKLRLLNNMLNKTFKQEKIWATMSPNWNPYFHDLRQWDPS